MSDSSAVVDNCRIPLVLAVFRFLQQLAFSLFFCLLFTLVNMSTWFDTIQKSFADVPVDAANDNGISTTEFLQAAESLTTLFGKALLLYQCGRHYGC